MEKISSPEKALRSKVFVNEEEMLGLFGQQDRNLRAIASFFPEVKLIPRGNELIIRGEEAQTKKVEEFLEQLLRFMQAGQSIDEKKVKYLYNNFASLPREGTFKEEVITQKKTIWPKNPAQEKYIKAVKENDIVFSIGPAGTGKTYMAMALAVSSLINRQTERIILVRPVIEAGEKLGFLPGDIYAKVDPYFRPLYDALYEMMDIEKLSRFIEKGIIEIAPLAYMRGRTLNDSFVILDDAQNTSEEQMKMFLTRLGFASQTVITGDITQIDLPQDKGSGLVHIQDVLKDIEGISFIYFTQNDIVRHFLVQKIIAAYERQGNIKK